MRITGLATGIDVDSVIKETMKPYRIKVDETKQKKEIVEIKQQLYRDVIKDCRDFYDKYFDITKSNSLLASKNYSTVKFDSSDSAAVNVTGLGGAVKDNYRVSVSQVAKVASVTMKDEELKNMDKISIAIDGKTIDIELSDEEKLDSTKLVDKINNTLKENDVKDVKVAYSQFSKGITIETKATGVMDGEKENKISLDMVKYQRDATGVIEVDSTGSPIIAESKALEGIGQDCKAIITNSKGEKFEYSGSKNNVVLDSVQFEFNDVTTNEVRITGKNDVTELKDNIVKFVNDYNSLISNLNDLTMTKRNSSYMPLTDEQRAEMSDKEIEMWESKVKEGQLYKDSDLTRIANSLKSIMRDNGSFSTSLEKIGISPISDFGSKNGMFTIDEGKLTAALEEDSESVMKLFINPAPTDASLSDSDKNNQTGLLVRMKDILYKESYTTSASLLKKAGYEGTSTSSNNTLSKSMTEYSKKISDLEKSLARREQALYSKYATLETMMNKLNSQMSSISSYFSS